VVGQVQRSVVRRFRFPAQEHKFSAGGTACQPATDKEWSVCAVDDARGTIDLKIGSTYSGPWPAALVEAGPLRTWEQRDRLRDLRDRVVRAGVGGEDEPFVAAREGDWGHPEPFGHGQGRATRLSSWSG
jgi:hypothetical protein